MLTHANYPRLLAASIGLFLFVVFAPIFGIAHAQEVDAANAAAIHPQLMQELGVTDGPVSFLIILDDQADIENDLVPDASISAASRTEHRQAIYDRLTQEALSSQAPLRAWLDEQGVAYRPFYIVNMIEVLGDEELVQALRRRPEVNRLVPNPVVESQLAVKAIPDWLEPLELSLDVTYNGLLPQSTLALPYGLTYTKADDVWALGYTGQGIVIADQDTGVQWDHNALMANYRGWDDATQTADHAYNWFDAWGASGRPARCSTDPQVPCDDHGHGTHTVGTLLGDATADGYTRIGMAPGAAWIGCRNMKNGVGTPASYMACFQFFLAPYPQGGNSFTDGDTSLAPHIISNSWSCPTSEGCDQDSLRTTVEVVRSAGQFVVAAAGNSGSACSTVMSPIATHDATFTIGAHDSGGTIAAFSSRGPVTSDGSGRLKPDISAPGFGVFSARAPDTYSTSNGTSMATPHVAGAAALLWSAVPSLIGDIDLTEQVLLKSAAPVPVSQCSGGSEAISPNNVYGYGRLDVLAAVEMALAPGSVDVTLLDYLGQPIASQAMTLIDKLTGYVVTAQTGAGGTALVPTVYAGNYLLNIDAGSAYFPNRDVIVTPSEDVQLTLTSNKPLAVTVGWFLAEEIGEVVRFRWQTTVEAGASGFHLLAEGDDGARRKLNGELIPSKVVDSVTPTNYTFSAPTAAAIFYLQELGVDGDMVEYGPFTLGTEYGALGTSENDELRPRVWLPMIAHE